MNILYKTYKLNLMNFFDNIKFFGKYFIIVLMIFLILKFIVNLKVYEAILLGLIITVSVLIIEALINPNVLSYETSFMPNPYDCSKCKINSEDVSISNFSNIVPNPMLNMESENSTNEERVSPIENFTNGEINGETTKYDGIKAIEKVIKNITSSVKSNLFPTSENEVQQPNKQIYSLVDKTNDEFEFKCVRVNKKPSDIETFENIEQVSLPLDELENFISDQDNKTHDMVNKLNTESKITKTTPNVKVIEEKILQEGPITYDASYVQYQTDGLEKEQGTIVLKEKEFKLDIGEPSIVKPFIQDGKNYYDKIKSYSSSAPPSNEALTNELKYGDYNYIGPLNNGMINPDYTFISPNNWYPIPPHAPVCVTNKKCTTCPIQMSDGKDYMNWASLEDFDNARRFTGNMGINVDYIKNVLNNDEGY